jgi:hypothetical protein
MRPSDLAEYLEHDPFLESPEPSGGQSPPVQHTAPLIPAAPETPTHPQRAEDIAREKHRSDILHMVIDVFPGARWVTKAEYQKRAEQRDRKARRRRG